MARLFALGVAVCGLAACGGHSGASSSASSSSASTTATTANSSNKASKGKRAKPGSRPSNDLLPNGSFESSTSGWRAYVTMGSVKQFAKSTKWTAVGKASLLMTASHSGSPTSGRAEAETAVRVRGGCTYTLVSAIKVFPRSAQLAIEERLVWESPGAKPQQLQRDATAKRPEVYRLTVSGRPPAKATIAEVGVGVIFGKSQVSTVAIDDVRLQSSCHRS